MYYGSGGNGLLRWLAGRLVKAARRRRLRRRHEAVLPAAAEAALHDPHFDPDVILADAQRVAERLEIARAHLDVEGIRAVSTGRFESADVARIRLGRVVAGKPPAAGKPPRREHFLVGIENHADPRDDRVHVAGLERLGSGGEASEFAAVWTYAFRDGHWVVSSADDLRSAKATLAAIPIATPWDAPELADRAILDLADDELAAPAPDTLLSADAEGRSALLDLSVVDGRWAPDVLAATVRRLLAAWERSANDGQPAFGSLADPACARALVRPRGDDTFTEVQDLELRRLEVGELLAGRQPPAVRLDLELRGRRQLTGADGEPVDGDRSRFRTFQERWLLEQHAVEEQPWRLVEVGAGDLAG